MTGRWLSLATLAEAHERATASLPKGPHVVKKLGVREVLQECCGEDWDWCGGSGACAACDDGRGVTLEDALAWRGLTGWMSGLAFGKYGTAHCARETYEELKQACDWRIPSRYGAEYMTKSLNGFEVHAADGVEYGMLVKCDCGTRKEAGNGQAGAD